MVLSPMFSRANSPDSQRSRLLGPIRTMSVRTLFTEMCIVSCLSATPAFDRSIVLLLFLQKQNLANAIYLFGLGTLLSGLGLKHMRIRSHHDLSGTLVTPYS